jgi:hypothetical protein
MNGPFYLQLSLAPVRLLVKPVFQPFFHQANFCLFKRGFFLPGRAM